jgi:uncharacterized iron-regulated membrane protein
LTLSAPIRNLSRMDRSEQLSAWRRWVQQPQNLWLRRALFQVHLWSGVGIGLYVLMISMTGSVLVYANELYRAATPKPIFSTASGPRLSDEQLKDAAMRAYPGYRVVNLGRARNLDQAVDVSLRRGGQEKKRLFDPRTGNDLGESVPLSIWLVSKLLDLHDNLLAGPTGRRVNGIGALALLALAATGLVIWWPGIKTWRRNVRVHRGVGWKRVVWELHSMIGFWSLGFILLFAVSGLYLAIPQPFEDLAGRLQPVLGAGDRVNYWLAILHFGRINGIGFACGGPGLCDKTTKAIWAVFGLAPAAMFATGAIMWWNRVLRPRWQALARPVPSDAVTTLDS